MPRILLCRENIKNVFFQGMESYVGEFFNRFSRRPSRSHLRDGTELPHLPLVVAASKTFKSRLLNVTKRSSCQQAWPFAEFSSCSPPISTQKKKGKTWTWRDSGLEDQPLRKRAYYFSNSISSKIL